MVKLTVYDFDKTIYNGETLNDFYRFYLKRNPIKIYTIFFQLYYFLLYILKIISLENLKEKFLKFLNNEDMKTLDSLINEFWKIKNKQINSWVNSEVLKNKKETEILVAISASPTFLIEKKLKEMGFDLVIGTDFDINNKTFKSKIISNNCKNYEKVLRLEEWAKKAKIEYEIINFYSDSIADKPLFDLAKNKFWVKKGVLEIGVPKKKTLLDKIFWK